MSAFRTLSQVAEILGNFNGNLQFPLPNADDTTFALASLFLELFDMSL